ncbi:uncharacterized protein LOC115094273 isoform X4 [Rhinatrema bivittatum]|uniref:uncharacterized protein LOC115094273 isoform X4 n=1 Tax=Rhinatrema bivittatum TaxID=194408 RepID=UPI00112AED63|nr:uncharacterized protein LOC115094273 isoform X4 [Rhinatrema bivittatum]
MGQDYFRSVGPRGDQKRLRFRVCSRSPGPPLNLSLRNAEATGGVPDARQAPSSLSNSPSSPTGTGIWPVFHLLRLSQKGRILSANPGSQESQPGPQGPPLSHGDSEGGHSGSSHGKIPCLPRSYGSLPSHPDLARSPKVPPLQLPGQTLPVSGASVRSSHHAPHIYQGHGGSGSLSPVGGSSGPSISGWLAHSGKVRGPVRDSGQPSPVSPLLPRVDCQLLQSCLKPCQVLEFLVACFDTRLGKVLLPEAWALKLMDQVQHLISLPVPTAWDYLQVLGSMASTIDLIPWAFVHMRLLQKALLSRWKLVSEEFRAPLPLSDTTIADLQWWLSLAHLLKGMPLETPRWIIITTDSSLSGWGAMCQTQSTQGCWSPVQSRWHINRLEA